MRRSSPGSFSIQDELPLQYVTVFSQTLSGSLVTLQPGQSLTQTATWNPAGGQAPVGTYSAYFSGPWNGTGATFQVGALGDISTSFTTDQADPPVNSPLPPSPPLSTVIASLTTARQTVRAGRPTAFTLTLTNQSKKPAKVTPVNGEVAIAIDRGSQLMGQSRKFMLKGKKTIAAGQSIKLRGTFSVNSSALASSRLAPGTYTLEVSYDGYTASRMIQIKR